jgi:RDD family protein
MASKSTFQSPTTSPRQNDALSASPASPGVRLHALALTVGLIIVTLGLGWMVWSVVEWHRSSTPSYRLTGLRLIRKSDGTPAGPVRVLVRALCCLVLVMPTIVACAIIGLSFVMGASAPDDLITTSRRAPWDVLAGTDVVRATAPQGRYAELPLAPYEAAQQN